MLAIRTKDCVVEITTKDCDEVESFSVLRIETKEELRKLLEGTQIIYITKHNGNKVFTFKDREEFHKRWTTLALSHKDKNHRFRESTKYLTTIKGKYRLIRDIAGHTISLATRTDNWSYANALGISDKFADMFIKNYNSTKHCGQENTAKLYFDDSSYKKWSQFMDNKYMIGLQAYRHQVKTGEINPRTKEIHLVNDRYNVNTK